MEIYRGAERGGKAGNGCSCAKGSHTVVFLLGNFGGKNDGDTQEVRIKIIVGCVLVSLHVTMVSTRQGEMSWKHWKSHWMKAALKLLFCRSLSFQINRRLTGMRWRSIWNALSGNWWK